MFGRIYQESLLGLAFFFGMLLIINLILLIGVGLFVPFTSFVCCFCVLRFCVFQ